MGDRRRKQPLTDQPGAPHPVMPHFPGSLTAARSRLHAVSPNEYARSRNQLDGAATHLSPYLTHGLLTLPQVHRHLVQAHALPAQHKLVYELGWRAYFQYTWRREGAGILRSLHAGLLPDGAYRDAVPADIREARTGLAVIDQAVRTLYDTGYLHNHARLWLASYMVHLRKVHWRAGADWLYGHLLDGDLASNHLSWQWVAATGSTKPYLFNAENVARHAPSEWHVTGTRLDVAYDTLMTWALQPHAFDEDAAEPPHPPASTQPPTARAEPALHTTPPFALRTVHPDELAHTWVVHPWALRAPDAVAGSAPPARRVGVFVADFHRQWPWSARRWQFVHDAMREVCDEVCWLEGRPPSSCQYTDNPHLHIAAPASPWPTEGRQAEPLLWPDPAQHCGSFSQYWRAVTQSGLPARPHRGAGPAAAG